MPLWLGALLAGASRLIFSRAGQWVLQIMVALGIGFAAKELAVDPMLSYVQQYWSGFPADLAAWVGVLNLDVYVVAILSAYAASTVKSVVLRKLSA